MRRLNRLMALEQNIHNRNKMNIPISAWVNPTKSEMNLISRLAIPSIQWIKTDKKNEQF